MYKIRCKTRERGQQLMVIIDPCHVKICDSWNFLQPILGESVTENYYQTLFFYFASKVKNKSIPEPSLATLLMF